MNGDLGTRSSGAGRGLTRREVLRGVLGASGLLAAGGVLAACAAPAAPTATHAPAAAPTAAPTAAPKEATKPAQQAPSAAKAVTIDATLRVPPATLELWKKETATFEQEHPAIKVNLTAFGPDYEQKLQVMVAGQTPGDVITTNNSLQLGFYCAQGVFMALEDLARAAKLDLGLFYKEALAYNTYEGKLYGLPFDAHPGIAGVFYAADAFDKAGIKIKDDWTYDDMLGIAKQLTVPDKVYGLVAPTATGRWETPMFSFGGGVLSKDLGKPAVRDAATLEAFSWAADLIHKHKVSPTPEQLTIENAQQRFSTGKAMMLFAGYWEILTALSLVKDFNWSCAPIPVGKADRFAGYSANDNHSIAAASKSAEQSFTWVAWMLGYQRQVDLVKLGQNPSGQMKVNEDPELEKALAKNHLVAHKIYLKHMASGKYSPSPTPKNQRQVELRTVMVSALDAVWIGKSTVDQAMKDVEPKVADIIAKPMP